MAIATQLTSDAVDAQRIVRFPRDLAPEDVARHLGCADGAVLGLHPFVVDGQLVMVLSSFINGMLGMDLLRALKASTVRYAPTQTTLLSCVLAPRQHQLYADERILAHDEVLVCIDPPEEYLAIDPRGLVTGVGAELLNLTSAFAGHTP